MTNSPIDLIINRNYMKSSDYNIKHTKLKLPNAIFGNINIIFLLVIIVILLQIL